LEHGHASLVTEQNIGIHDEIMTYEGKGVTSGGAALNSTRACNYILSKIGLER
jgi:hypothetical protein